MIKSKKSRGSVYLSVVLVIVFVTVVFFGVMVMDNNSLTDKVAECEQIIDSQEKIIATMNREKLSLESEFIEMLGENKRLNSLLKYNDSEINNLILFNQTCEGKVSRLNARIKNLVNSLDYSRHVKLKKNLIAYKLKAKLYADMFRRAVDNNVRGLKHSRMYRDFIKLCCGSAALYSLPDGVQHE